jgi:MFS family permease
MAIFETELPLLSSRRFVQFSGAKFSNQLAQNSLVYGLIILVSRQDSSLATSAFVLAATLPSVFLSLPGGVAADALPHKLVLVAGLAARMAIAWWFIGRDPGVGSVIAMSLAAWTIVQFYGPAESAALTSVARSHQMGTANALLNGVTLAAQILGAGLIAPLAIKAAGSDALFTTVLVFFAIAALLFIALPRLTTERKATERVGLLNALPRGLRIVRREPTIARVTLLMVLMDAALLVVVVAVPAFMSDVLRTSPENAVYIFVPAAIGVIAGLVLSPAILRVVPARAVATIGFALFIGVVLTLPYIRDVAQELDQRTFLPLLRIEELLNVRREIAATVLLLPFAGLGLSIVRVAGRTVVYHHAPPDSIGQVFATQSALGSLVSIIPTLVAGLLIDVLDVRAVLVVTGCLCAFVAAAVIVAPFRRGSNGTVAP